MRTLLEDAARLISSAGFVAAIVDVPGNGASAVAFEGDVAVGFLLAYEGPNQLIERWATDSNAVVRHHALALRRAGHKAWNAYLILLTAGETDQGQAAALSEIEEDLVGTRKIVRGGVKDNNTLRAALLPLLPLQSAPRLDPIDMQAEISARASEISPSVMTAFFSSADESIVLQAMEDAP